MDIYVLGFAFTFDGRVALIRKNRPEWQAGRLNGIGGHVSDVESHISAMAREFYEETGTHIPQELWTYRGLMRGEDWVVHVFATVHADVEGVTTVTDETVELLDDSDDLINDSSFTIENVRALIELCRIPPAEPSGNFPFFELRYG
jgi:8-oxo-dGTP pyrophosphatase MutT (NUDIX family)